MKCRKASYDQKMRARRGALKGFTAQEEGLAELIRSRTEKTYELIVLARRTSLTSGRLTLWATWLTINPDTPLPSDLVDALHKIGMADATEPNDPLAIGE